MGGSYDRWHSLALARENNGNKIMVGAATDNTGDKVEITKKLIKT